MRRGVTLDGNLFISKNAHLIMPYHPALDRASEAKLGARAHRHHRQGRRARLHATRRARVGIRDGRSPRRARCSARSSSSTSPRRTGCCARSTTPQTLQRRRDPGSVPALSPAGSAPYITDTALLLDALDRQRLLSVLFEGAQATMLDIDHGTYPVHHLVVDHGRAAPRPAPACRPRKHPRRRSAWQRPTPRASGSGPFPTEMTGAVAEAIRARGNEYGATTGRPRRCGWFDAVVLRYAARINGLDTVALTKLDVLDQCETVQVVHRLPVPRRHPHRVPRGRDVALARGRAGLRGDRGLDARRPSARRTRPICRPRPGAISSGSRS